VKDLRSNLRILFRRAGGVAPFDKGVDMAAGVKVRLNVD